MNNQQKTALAALNIFEGKWHTTGEIFAIGDKPATTMQATDVYEWLPGGHFLKHTVDAQMDGEYYQSWEVIGYNKDTDNYTIYVFDSLGNASQQTAGFKGDKWILGDDKMRATVTPQDADTLLADWELKDDAGKWQPWMHITLKK